MAQVQQLDDVDQGVGVSDAGYFAPNPTAVAAAPTGYVEPAWVTNAKQWLGTDLEAVYPTKTIGGRGGDRVIEDRSQPPTGYRFDNGKSQYVYISNELDASGKPVVTNVQNRSNGINELISFAAMIPGPWQFACQAYMAVKAIDSGNIAAGAAQLAGLGGLAEVQQAIQLADAIDKGNVANFATSLLQNSTIANSAGATMLTDTLSVADAAKTALITAKVIEGTPESLASAATMAGQLTKSSDLTTAGAALTLTNAINTAVRTGNFAGVVGAVNAFANATGTTPTSSTASITGPNGQNLITGSDSSATSTLAAPVFDTKGMKLDTVDDAARAASAAGFTTFKYGDSTYNITGSTGTSPTVSTTTGTAGQNLITAGSPGSSVTATGPTAAELALTQALNERAAAITEGLDISEGEKVAVANQIEIPQLKPGEAMFTVSNPMTAGQRNQVVETAISGAKTFDDAYAAAREGYGKGKTFTWNGQNFSTSTRAEDPGLAAASDNIRMSRLLENVGAGGGRGSSDGYDTNAAVNAATGISSPGTVFGLTSGAGRGSYAGFDAADEAAWKDLISEKTDSDGAKIVRAVTILEHLKATGAVGLGQQAQAFAQAFSLTTGGTFANGLQKYGTMLEQWGKDRTGLQITQDIAATDKKINEIKDMDSVWGQMKATANLVRTNPYGVASYVGQEIAQEAVPTLAGVTAAGLAIWGGIGVGTAVTVGAIASATSDALETLGSNGKDAFDKALARNLKAGMSPAAAEAQARNEGLAVGGISAAITLPAEVIADKLLLGAYFHSLKGGVGAFAARYGSMIATEKTSEALETIGQELVATYAENGEITKKDVFKATGTAAFAALVAGGAVAGIGGGAAIKDAVAVAKDYAGNNVTFGELISGSNKDIDFSTLNGSAVVANTANGGGITLSGYVSEGLENSGLNASGFSSVFPASVTGNDAVVATSSSGQTFTLQQLENVTNNNPSIDATTFLDDVATMTPAQIVSTYTSEVLQGKVKVDTDARTTTLSAKPTTSFTNTATVLATNTNGTSLVENNTTGAISTIQTVGDAAVGSTVNLVTSAVTGEAVGVVASSTGSTVTGNGGTLTTAGTGSTVTGGTGATTAGTGSVTGSTSTTSGTGSTVAGDTSTVVGTGVVTAVDTSNNTATVVTATGNTGVVTTAGDVNVGSTVTLSADASTGTVVATGTDASTTASTGSTVASTTATDAATTASTAADAATNAATTAATATDANTAVTSTTAANTAATVAADAATDASTAATTAATTAVTTGTATDANAATNAATAATVASNAATDANVAANTAATVTTGTDSNVTTATDANVGTGTDANVTTATDSNVTTATDANTNVTTDANTNVATDANTNVTTDPNVTTNVTTNPNVTTNVTTNYQNILDELQRMREAEAAAAASAEAERIAAEKVAAEKAKAEKEAADRAKRQRLGQQATQEASQSTSSEVPLTQLKTGLTTTDPGSTFEGPLAKFLKQVKEDSYVNKPQPQQAEQMNQPQPQPSSYYNYGQEQNIDELLAKSQLPETGVVGAKRGGLATPLMAAGGGTRYGNYAGGGLNMVNHSGKNRVDFRTGDAVTGPGDGQSDDIPAMLADGEFVFPADVVAALGNGSTKAGSDKLYDMMHGIRARARSSHPKELPPPAKSPLEYLKPRKKARS